MTVTISFSDPSHVCDNVCEPLASLDNTTWHKHRKPLDSTTLSYVSPFILIQGQDILSQQVQ